MQSLSQIILLLGGWTVVLTAVLAFIGNNAITRLKIQWEKNSQEQLNIFEGRN